MPYFSAERMLNRYVDLYFRLTSARSMTLPDPRSAAAAAASVSRAHSGNSVHHAQLAELADIAKCLSAADFTQAEREMLTQLFRPRRRFCKRCRMTCGFEDMPRCPNCHAARREGWSFENYPTLDVLAEHLRTHTDRTAWSLRSVGRLRTRAIQRLERTMHERGMLTDADNEEQAAG